MFTTNLMGQNNLSYFNLHKKVKEMSYKSFVIDKNFEKPLIENNKEFDMLTKFNKQGLLTDYIVFLDSSFFEKTKYIYNDKMNLIEKLNYESQDTLFPFKKEKITYFNNKKIVKEYLKDSLVSTTIFLYDSIGNLLKKKEQNLYDTLYYNYSYYRNKLVNYSLKTISDELIENVNYYYQDTTLVGEVKKNIIDNELEEYKYKNGKTISYVQKVDNIELIKYTYEYSDEYSVEYYYLKGNLQSVTKKKDGLIFEIKNYSDNSNLSVISFEYFFDKKGNILKSIRKLNGKPVLITKYTLKYFPAVP
jgi:hypothetical protein